MIWTLMSAIAIILHVTCLPGTAGALTLVRDGKAESVIVIADERSESANLGAAELQSWLRKMTGVTVAIVPEGQLAQNSSESLILVGDTKLSAELGLRSDSFDLEEIRIRTHGNALALIGDDRRPNGLPLLGTLWAVETFAEQFLGVRMLWPGELGEVFPKRETVEVGHIDLKKVPALRQRRIRNIRYGERTQMGLDKLGWSGEDFKRHRADSGRWFQFHRIGGSFKGGYGHAYGNYWERFHQEHPDWFALQPDGTRDNSRASDGHRARLCVSNHELIEQGFPYPLTMVTAPLSVCAIRVNPGTLRMARW